MWSDENKQTQGREYPTQRADTLGVALQAGNGAPTPNLPCLVEGLDYLEKAFALFDRYAAGLSPDMLRAYLLN